ncbi:type II toxin-antitoxin system Phd/YefM family antitoxin [Polaromonas sp.]|uniref:type II toxin-antitoxin system Phd/YefM family antitoxin n=1 Tax=Polaromonas sp. TaxID=1869339 RepID=UPI0035693114
MKTISAADANRHFSGLLRDVATGEVVTVLSRGKPVATIGPVARESGPRQMARQTLLARLRQNKASGARDWTRDELYEG